MEFREIFLPRNFPDRENLIIISSIICNKTGAFVHIINSSLIVGITGIRNVVKPFGLIKFFGRVSHLLEIGKSRFEMIGIMQWIHAACAGGIPPKLQCDMCQ